MLYQIPYFNISDAVGYVAEVGGSVFCHLKWSEQTIQRILCGLIWTISCFVFFFLLPQPIFFLSLRKILTMRCSWVAENRLHLECQVL